MPGDELTILPDILKLLLAMFVVNWFALHFAARRFENQKIFQPEPLGLAMWALLFGFVSPLTFSLHSLYAAPVSWGVLTVFMVYRSLQARYVWGQALLIALVSLIVNIWLFGQILHLGVF